MVFDVFHINGSGKWSGSRRLEVDTMDPIRIEKFANTDLMELQQDLQRSGLDSWQIAELLSAFLAAKGYGVSSQDLHAVASHPENFGGSLQHMQEMLEQIALMM